MNRDHAQSIRQTFGETVCRVPRDPGVESSSLVAEHSQLAELREYARENNIVPVYNPFPDPSRPVKCPNGCGHTWTTEKKRDADEKHFKTGCWFTRKTLFPPLFPENGPGDWPAGMVVEWRSRGKKRVGVLCGKRQVRSLETRAVVKSLFWMKKGSNVKFRRPFNREIREVQHIVTKFTK